MIKVLNLKILGTQTYNTTLYFLFLILFILWFLPKSKKVKRLKKQNLNKHKYKKAQSQKENKSYKSVKKECFINLEHSNLFNYDCFSFFHFSYCFYLNFSIK